MNKKRYIPNVVRGGMALPLNNKPNMYYMSGAKHEQGGIDIGEDDRTGLEVEDGEVVQITKDKFKVFSSVPFLNGKSPAQKVINGENPNTVFQAQENYKDRNNLNDDGTKKAEYGMEIEQNAKTKLKGYIDKYIKKTKNLYGYEDSTISDNKYQQLGTLIQRLGNSVVEKQYFNEKENADYMKALLNSTDDEFQELTENIIKENDQKRLKKYNNNSPVEEQYRCGGSRQKAQVGIEDKKNNTIIINGEKFINYDNLRVGKMINHVENPDSSGWHKPTRTWRTPTRPTDDKDQRGMGIDLNENADVKPFIEYTKDKERILSEKNERYLRFKAIRDGYKSANNRITYAKGLYNPDAKISEFKKEQLIDLIYNQGGKTIANSYLFNKDNVDGVAFMNALVNGTDEEFYKLTNEAFKRFGRPSRNDRRDEFYKKNKEIKRNGGEMNIPKRYYTVTSNGKTNLRMIPSTGERQKAGAGFLAFLPGAIELITNSVGSGLDYYFTNKSNKAKDDAYDSLKESRNATNDKIKDLINSLKYSGKPVQYYAGKLNTRHNVNPQLDKIREDLYAYYKLVDENTSSSKVALARKRSARNEAQLKYNQIMVDKENKENELINEDIKNKQGIINKSIEAYNKYIENKQEFENKKIGMLANFEDRLYSQRKEDYAQELSSIDNKYNNNINLVNNIAESLNNTVNSYYTTKQDYNNRLYTLMNTPGADLESAYDSGAISKKDYRILKEVRKKRTIDPITKRESNIILKGLDENYFLNL